MNPRVIILTVVLAVIVAPATAFAAHLFMSNQNDQSILSPKLQTKDAIKKALDAENNYLSKDEQLSNIAVSTVERYQSVWYIASVTYGDPVQSSIALVGDLRGDPNKLTVVLRPEEVFPNVNISNGIGVPYDVIDKINAFYSTRDSGDE